MIHLIAAAIKNDIAGVRETSPELWRQIRRYNLPVQLALAAADEAAKAAEDPAKAALFSLAPCQSGSPELHQWTQAAAASGPNGHIGNLRVNPTHTLHAVDNLGLSAFAIMQGNHEYCLGLGGAAGQAWCGLEAVGERLLAGCETEALLMAGDQEGEAGRNGLGIALLFSREPKPYGRTGRFVKVESVERIRLGEMISVQPHAAAGLQAFVAGIHHGGSGRVAYEVAAELGNGMDKITIILEIT
ncbi:MAG: hypothetical protein JWR19_2001 [Pedosphaera sp.]|nr:hypothetical protein [Pedosphaera sp.]